MKAEYIGHFGDDLKVVNAARVSHDNESDWTLDKDGAGENFILRPPDERLIRYLARNGHFTPFTHSAITLRETVPFFVARQRFKHVVGLTYNEVSRRYVDSEPTFFMPETWRLRAPNIKQGSSSETFQGDYYHEYADRVYELAYRCYTDMIKDGIAPEQARMVLPNATYTSYYVTGSLYAFANSYRLRSKPDAQKEIQDLAAQWDEIIRPLFPVSWASLVDE
jgi:thymidylate synthase (FAD)